MANQKQSIIAQSGVIPYRIRRGRLEVALVTASSGPHWTVPKGHVEPDMSPEDSAAKEAYEESGLIGRVDNRRLGSYIYQKRGKRRHVNLYSLAVRRQLKAWPEMMLRKRRWMTPAEAAERVRSLDLRTCIQRFERSMMRGRKRQRRAA
jgi:8-oxo-dGTP pyrophosphatase MutT (NUDIX family)